MASARSRHKKGKIGILPGQDINLAIEMVEKPRQIQVWPWHYVTERAAKTYRRLKQLKFKIQEKRRAKKELDDERNEDC